MSRTPLPPVGIRMPEDLKSWLKQVSAANRRSVSAEVLVRLEESRRREEQAKAGEVPA